VTLIPSSAGLTEGRNQGPLLLASFPSRFHNYSSPRIPSFQGDKGTNNEQRGRETIGRNAASESDEINGSGTATRLLSGRRHTFWKHLNYTSRTVRSFRDAGLFVTRSNGQSPFPSPAVSLSHGVAWPDMGEPASFFPHRFQACDEKHLVNHCDKGIHSRNSQRFQHAPAAGRFSRKRKSSGDCASLPYTCAFSLLPFTLPFFLSLSLSLSLRYH